jgi:putative endonuclease
MCAFFCTLVLQKNNMKSYFVYILKCNDASYYTGFTNNLERRLQEHGSGKNKGCYTFDKRPLELVWYETFNDVLDAISTEKKIKGWSRIKKEALINEDWEKLVLYSKNYTQYGAPFQGEKGSSTGSD